MCTRAECSWFCLGGFLCAITVSGQVDQKHQNRLHLFMGWVICGVVGEHKHVCSKACDAHDVAAVARFFGLGLLLLLLSQMGAGFKLLLSQGPR